MTDTRIELDTLELLGLSQVSKVSAAADQEALGRVLSKVGENPPESPAPFVARLLSKIGEDAQL